MGIGVLILLDFVLIGGMVIVIMVIMIDWCLILIVLFLMLFMVFGSLILGKKLYDCFYGV